MSSFKEKAVSETFELVGAPDPVMTSGDVSQFGINRSRRQGHDATITSACQNAELAVQWIDQWFSDEGFMLGNYGIENLAFEYNDEGVPQYTDLIINNTDGLSQQAATVFYTNAFAPGLYTQETRFNIWPDETMAAVYTWADSTTGESLMPNVSLTTEEAEQYSLLSSDIQTIASENIVKFIIGETPLSSYDAFKQELISMGLDECVEIYQSALNRYSER